MISGCLHHPLPIMDTVRADYSMPVYSKRVSCTSPLHFRILIKSLNMSLRKRKNSLRLSGYDYSQSGMYFITIIAHKRLHLFGSIENDVVTVSKLSDIIASCWQQIPDHFPSVDLGSFVIMPNHVHGIIILNDSSEKVTVGHVIKIFKGAVTRIARKTELDVDLDHPVWHRNFHDRIIRNEQEYKYIDQYVHTNPSRWEADTFYE